jgi:glycosyltransferase involved in cell wall biosynthesis
MYCGSCLRDNALATALLELGEDVLLIPTYTPIRTDEASVSIRRVFFGGVNLYLHQRFPWLRHLPRPVTRILDSPAILRTVSRLAVSTDARELGEMTLSILRGEQGNQVREAEELIAWLASEVRPDIVSLPNILFAGFARLIQRKLQVPVVCTLSGEDIFLDALPETYREPALGLIRQHVLHLGGVVAPSRYFASVATESFGVPAERVQVVYPGIRLAGYPETPEKANKGPAAIGFLARVCPEKGLHLLVEAFRILRDELGWRDSRLRVAGYLGARDRAYFGQVLADVRRHGMEGVFDFLGAIDRDAKIEFLRTIDLFSVPTVYREPKGLFVLEALACGTPVVLPRHGSFPELVEATKGGVLIDPGDPRKLAGALWALAKDAGQREAMGRHGYDAVRRHFTAKRMASETLEVFSRCVERGRL